MIRIDVGFLPEYSKSSPKQLYTSDRMCRNMFTVISAIFAQENVCKEWEQADIEVFCNSFSVFIDGVLIVKYVSD